MKRIAFLTILLSQGIIFAAIQKNKHILFKGEAVVSTIKWEFDNLRDTLYAVGGKKFLDLWKEQWHGQKFNNNDTFQQIYIFDKKNKM